jgi:putative tryptophan/tyrosine transport system substrate-binding protein
MHFRPWKRREFMALLGVAGVAWPLAAQAQQATVPVVGFMSARSPETSVDLLAAFRRGLAESGFVEGQNVAIEFRWSRGEYNSVAALAADLASRRVAVIVATGSPVALAAEAATSTIPIVFTVAVDPVGAGLVASLNRPGGNLTGMTTLGVEVGPKRLELLRELIPMATIVAALINPTNSNAETQWRDLETTARALGLQIHVLHASTDRDLDAAFATLGQLRPGGLVIGTDLFLSSRIEQLAALALRYSVPTIFQYREFVSSGGLMSYGTSPADSYHQMGVYTGRILKGEKPANLPVQQTTKIELLINMRTAKALGLEVPPTLLGRADEVIE